MTTIQRNSRWIALVNFHVVKLKFHLNTVTYLVVMVRKYRSVTDWRPKVMRLRIVCATKPKNALSISLLIDILLRISVASLYAS